ncbi:3446_t:CDS:2 [Funneliformis caledonium]|uniref:3446_t:CDS:1 n=2 Tax=Funneliformis TaxID=1117308 RepID=A0A9N9BTV0_9GLOM|nr:5828_t:CDS:2 [Funneliformis mosseae]CAG8578038.1 3446_t:CDS:2 [Funneliformis caledonium]
MRRPDLKYCPTCRNLMFEIEDTNASKLLLKCRTCDYIEESEHRDQLVDFMRKTNYCHDDQFHPRLFQDASFRRCIINCNKCDKKTCALEWHSHRKESMNVEYWCEECEQQQPSPHKNVGMIYDTERPDTQIDQEGYYTDEERIELDTVGQEDF